MTRIVWTLMGVPRLQHALQTFKNLCARVPVSAKLRHVVNLHRIRRQAAGMQGFRIAVAEQNQPRTGTGNYK